MNMYQKGSKVKKKKRKNESQIKNIKLLYFLAGQVEQIHSFHVGVHFFCVVAQPKKKKNIAVAGIKSKFFAEVFWY